MIFTIFIACIICQRLTELAIAKRNEIWMKRNGAIEVGKEHYPLLVIMHILFFLSLCGEVYYYNKEISSAWPLLLLFFLAIQLLRVWAMMSLGKFWNTKILVLPNVRVITAGPYKYIRHPNYLVVALELLIIPFLFQAYYTALLFTLLNAIMLFIRIPIEEKALLTYTKGGNAYLLSKLKTMNLLKALKRMSYR